MSDLTDSSVQEEVAAAKKMLKKEEKMAEKEVYKASINPFDGLIHNDDRSMQEPGSGKVVAGVNMYSQKEVNALNTLWADHHDPEPLK